MLSHKFIFRKSKNFTSDNEISTAPTVPIKHYPRPIARGTDGPCAPGENRWPERLTTAEAGCLDGSDESECRWQKRFQGTRRRMIFPIHSRAARWLLLLPVPTHDGCGGVSGRCQICLDCLHRWRDWDCLGDQGYRDGHLLSLRGSCHVPVV
jgi:hypothetical protein